jgi:multiple antibiotic resistance protein
MHLAMILDIIKDFLGHTISIFTIMNPLSAGAIMLTLIGDHTSKKEVEYIARKSTKTVFIAMLIVFLSGTYIFSFFGIQADGLRVFGGIILLVMGFDMVQGRGKKINHRSLEHEAAMRLADISIVPLSIPIIVGPGLTTTLINLSITHQNVQSYFSISMAIVLCAIGNYIIIKNMPRIKNRLGENGIKVFSRLMGLVVGSLAAQMFLTGAFGLYRTYVQ